MTWTNSTGSDVDSGDTVVIEGRGFVALVNIANGAVGELAALGVFKMTKQAGEAMLQGKDVYWDSTQGIATHVVGANVKIGYCHAAATSAAVLVEVNLNQ